MYVVLLACSSLVRIGEVVVGEEGVLVEKALPYVCGVVGLFLAGENRRGWSAYLLQARRWLWSPVLSYV